MILTAIYQILSTGEVWNPTDLYKIDMPEPLKEKQREKAIKQAKKLLIVGCSLLSFTVCHLTYFFNERPSLNASPTLSVTL